MFNHYGIDILFAEMPMPVQHEETIVVPQAQYDAAKQNPPELRPHQVFVIEGHPAMSLYGDADSYKDCPDLGHC